MLTRARYSAVLALAVSLQGAPAWAQDERIEDPELTGAPKPAAAPGAAAAAAPPGDERIEDPELTGGPKSAAADSGGFSNRPEYPHDAIWRTTLATRWGVDTQWTRPSQDILEGTSIASVEVEQRRSETLMLSLGVRARHWFGMRKSGTTLTQLDAVPISAFADVTPTAGYHVRAGYQVTQMGRLDLFNATNVLAVYDLRSGPVTMTEAAAVGQPAVRFDYDAVPGFALQAFYVPFFVPHLVSAYGTDYSIGTGLERAGDSDGSLNSGAQSAAFRSRVAGFAKGGLDAFAPPPNFTKPQGALRATLSGTAGELSATVATAIEHLPTLGFDTRPTTPITDIADPHYDRFGLVSVDAATDVGPVQLAVEGAYFLHRTLGKAGSVVAGTPPTPTWLLGDAGHTDMVQIGLHAEIMEGIFGVEAETFGLAALSRAGGAGYEWVGFVDGRYFGGVAGGIHVAPEGSAFKAEVGGGVLTGPTTFVMPRLQWEAVHSLFLELGAVFVGGPTPKWNAPAPTAGAFLGSPRLSVGGLYNDVDQIFTGVRWVP